jgi:ATP phosphoribosyltransferase regulatory subunit
MKRDLLHTPEGVRDIYNGECLRKIVLQNRLHDVCTLYGYNDIQTPTFEFFDVFNKERGSVPSNEMFKLIDRYGNTLVLRPDMTPAIARSAAKYFSENVLPLKLCYVGNTFINVSKSYQGKLKENTTIGAELIGDDSIDADFEIISMVIDCMKNAGLTEFQVEIGNVAFFKGLLKEGGISGDDEELLVSLIQEKNYFGVEELLNSLNIDKKIATVLLELPQLFGSVEVLSKATELTSNSDCLAAIDRLIKLYDLLKVTGNDRYITFDLGALSNHTYYTGIIFRAYTFGTGEPVINGGRYDKLIGQFGNDKASIGFSITVDSLMSAMTRQHIDIPADNNGVLLVYDSSLLIQTIRIADQLRKLDINVCAISANDTKTEEQYAKYAINSQLASIVFINSSSLDENGFVTVINAETMKKTTIHYNDFIGGKLS